MASICLALNRSTGRCIASLLMSLAVFCFVSGGAGHATPDSTVPSLEKPLPPQPDGDRLVRLLKEIADTGLLTDPERMVTELNIPMKFETKPSDFQAKGCDAGGDYKSFLVTKAEVSNSWFTEGPEGVRDMKIPTIFPINPGSVVGAPKVSFGLYRTVQCASPDYTHVEATLNFNNLSSFSCLTPDRLRRLIGADYQLATDGVSQSTYSPPAQETYGVRLEFTFRAGATCAVGATIRQDSRNGNRENRAFVKWRACYDKAKAEYCAVHPGLKASDWGVMNSYASSKCESRESYIAQETSGSGPPPSWPFFKPMSDHPCDD